MGGEEQVYTKLKTATMKNGRWQFPKSKHSSSVQLYKDGHLHHSAHVHTCQAREYREGRIVEWQSHMHSYVSMTMLHIPFSTVAFHARLDSPWIDHDTQSVKRRSLAHAQCQGAQLRTVNAFDQQYCHDCITTNTASYIEVRLGYSLRGKVKSFTGLCNATNPQTILSRETDCPDWIYI